MNWHFSEMIQWLADKDRSRLLLKGAWGLEKESHRVTSDGKLALTPHPCVFGDKLRHPRIKTDFSESQLEFVTPPLPSIGEACAELERIHDEAEAGIGEELLWPFSMPPELPEEKDIPIARYSDTAEGREQELYRVSLAHRYGKKMQMISGLHYNFSFHDGLLDLLYECWGQRRKANICERLVFCHGAQFSQISLAAHLPVRGVPDIRSDVRIRHRR